MNDISSFVITSPCSAICHDLQTEEQKNKRRIKLKKKKTRKEAIIRS